MKTSVNHLTAVESEVHPFSVAVDFQDSYGVSSRGSHCCWTFLPFYVTSGGSALPVAEIHSIRDVQARDPGCFLRIERVSDDPRTRPFDPLPSRIPVSSILYRLEALMAMISGMARCLNHCLMTLVEAPLIRWESIALLLWTLTDGFLLIKDCTQFFPRGWESPWICRMRSAKSLSC